MELDRDPCAYCGQPTSMVAYRKGNRVYRACCSQDSCIEAASDGGFPLAPGECDLQTLARIDARASWWQRRWWLHQQIYAGRKWCSKALYWLADHVEPTLSPRLYSWLVRAAQWCNPSDVG